MIIEQLESRRLFSAGSLTWVTSGSVFSGSPSGTPVIGGIVLTLGDLNLPAGVTATVTVDPTNSFKGSAALTKTGTLVITGTADADRISVIQSGKTIKFPTFVNGKTFIVGVKATAIKRILVEAGAGDDKVYIDPAITQPVTVSGGTGNDTLDGNNNCTLSGGAGNDHLYAPEHSVLNGGDGNDILTGDRTNSVTGGAGHDVAIVVNPHPGIGAGFTSKAVLDSNGDVDGQPLFAQHSSVETFNIDPNDVLTLNVSFA